MLLRSAILAAARNQGLKRLVTTAPVSRNVVRRYVAGEGVEDDIRVTRELASQGLAVSLDHLGEDTTEPQHAVATTKAYLTLLQRLADEGLDARSEVSVKLSAIGQALDEAMALEHAREICTAAQAVGTTVTLDMEDHTTTDSTLAVLTELRRDFPDTGAVLQAYLRRTESDCRDLAYPGSRVRLCKGAYDEPPEVAFTDPHLVAITDERARWYGRERGSYEYQMLYGIRPDEQRRLVGRGETVRVYVPYGDEWYGYLMRRLAERPANVTFFLRSMVSRS